MTDIISDFNAIYLRKFRKKDALALCNALSDRRVVKHMATEEITLQNCKDIIADAKIHWKKNEIGSYAVVNNGTDEIVGWAGFKFWKNEEFEIVLVLSPKAWGIGLDLCRSLIQKAKEEFLLKKIYVLLPETRKSFKKIGKLGFTFCEMETFNNESFLKFVKIL